MKEQAETLARTFFEVYGEILLSEKSSPDEMHWADTFLWEKIDEIAAETSTDRNDVRKEVISVYTFLVEKPFPVPPVCTAAWTDEDWKKWSEK